MVFREHPDVYRFSWLKVDFARAWVEEISRLSRYSRSIISPSDADDEEY